MTLGTKQDGSAVIELTKDEWQQFRGGKLLVRHSGDAYGVFRVELKLTRPKEKSHRFPPETYELPPA